MLTISEVAGLAGVTVRAVRHYHQRGLLPEPARDSSGYRRYDADDLVELIRIRTLAEAGVPLARVAELLEADETAFHDAIVDLDVELRQRQRQIAEHRAKVKLLVGGDSLALPQVAVDYLDKLRALGVSEESVKVERDSWILINARYPEKVPEWMAAKTEQLDWPAFKDMYLAFDRARDWAEDDPRLEKVADQLAAVFRQISDQLPTVGQDDSDLEQPVVELLDAKALDASPAWRRVVELLQHRGWTGWSDVRPTEA